MWEAIAKVSTGLTLAAFIAAVVVWAYRQRLLQTERLIQSAREEDRAGLVQQVLEAVKVDTQGLTREQRYDLANRLIHSRSHRFLISAIVVLVITVVAAIVAVFALSKRDFPVVKEPELYQQVLNKWEGEHADFIQRFGYPGEMRKPISVWYQFFSQGFIAYNTSDNWSLLFYFDSMTYRRVQNPGALISEHHSDRINKDLFNQLMITSETAKVKEKYLTLLTEKKIIGGIGTIYVKEGLLERMGEPLQGEQFANDIWFIKGQHYDLLVNVLNRHTDPPQGTGIRAVLILMPDAKFDKHTVWLFR